MKLLIVSQWFWPENMQINDVARGLQSKGNEVHVLTAKPNYQQGGFYKGYGFFKKGDEKWHGVNIFRVNIFPRGKGSKVKLIINYLSFVLFGTIRALLHKESYDFILVYGVSPVTAAIPAIIIGKRKKSPVYFWVQDLWPQSVSEAGNVHNKHILTILDVITKWIYRQSKKLLIKSEGFRSYIMAQGVANDKMIYYPDTAPAFYHEVMPKEEIKKILPKTPFMIMFAGNIGEAQGIDIIIEAAKAIYAINQAIHFVILGDGDKKEYTIRKVRQYGLDDNVHLLGSFPPEQMPHFFACADALILSLKKSIIFALTIPNKLQAYLACGKPIIGALDGSSAKVITDSGSGFVSEPGDCQGMIDNILTVYNLTDADRKLLGSKGRQYFDRHFDREKLLDQLLHLVRE